MQKVQIDKKQFFILLLMSILANDKISGLFARDLKQDKLLALFGSLFLSLLLFTMYYYIFKNTKFKNFYETIEIITGKFFSKIIFMLYALYFLFIAGLDSRDIIQFVHLYLMHTTPLIIVSILFVGTVLFTLLHGIEVLARVAQICMMGVFFIFITFVPLAYIVNRKTWTNLFPLNDIGIIPIIKNSLQMAVTIPFGEFFVVMLLVYYVRDKKKLWLTGISAQLFAGFMLITIFVLNLILLSPLTLEFMLSPPVRVAKLIDVKGFIQRYDLITILAIILLSFIKTGLLLYGAKHCFTRVIKLRKENILYILLAIITIAITHFYFPNYDVLLEMSMKYVMPYINTTFEFFIPFILFILSFFKKGKVKDEEPITNEEKDNKKKKKFDINNIKEKFRLKKQ